MVKNLHIEGKSIIDIINQAEKAADLDYHEIENLVMNGACFYFDQLMKFADQNPEEDFSLLIMGAMILIKGIRNMDPVLFCNMEQLVEKLMENKSFYKE